jgi:hypothetical protein
MYSTVCTIGLVIMSVGDRTAEGGCPHMFRTVDSLCFDVSLVAGYIWPPCGAWDGCTGVIVGTGTASWRGAT